ncbi:MAG TPA: ATP-binding protein [Pyrinomonadaceae bacterium]|nr:ATP-binding protein [Pyrinomonadaceae bacterium]
MAVPAEATPAKPRPESASTLQTIVELVRRIMHADVASIVSFSLTENTITWKAASGLRAHAIDEHPLVLPITNEITRRALAANTVSILEGVGVRDELPASDFPVHTAEGIRDLVFAPLKARGQTLGALLAGYRSAHYFTDDERELLQDLAALAALALDNARLLETVSAVERIWEQTFDAIGEGILVYDYQMQIVRCNVRAAEMLEMKPAEVIGLSFSEAFGRMFGKRAAAYYLTESRGASSVFEVEAEDRRRYLVSIFPLQHPEGDSVSVVTWTDVTRFLEMQEQLSRSRRLASVGELAAGVAHEINNPLAAITTCAEATMRDMRQTDETQALADSHQWSYYLGEIVRQALRCKEITRGLLDLTRQRQANRVVCDLNAIAAQCAKVAMQRANSSAVQFEINVDEETGEVATDAAMLRQILDNLLSNAIDALGEGSGRISVSTTRDGDRMAIEVADTGHGIPADLVAKVFDPFFSTKGPGKGYGLGLAISLTLAESLGGSLTVESKEGAGSRFRLWIPRRVPEAQG